MFWPAELVHLSQVLKRRGIRHEVLNAKQHEREAIIVQQAGRPGAITIATNMAGRGTDIVLGGNLEAELEEAESSKDEIVKNWKKRLSTSFKIFTLFCSFTKQSPFESNIWFSFLLR